MIEEEVRSYHDHRRRHRFASVWPLSRPSDVNSLAHFFSYFFRRDSWEDKPASAADGPICVPRDSSSSPVQTTQHQKSPPSAEAKMEVEKADENVARLGRRRLLTYFFK